MPLVSKHRNQEEKQIIVPQTDIKVVSAGTQGGLAMRNKLLNLSVAALLVAVGIGIGWLTAPQTTQGNECVSVEGVRTIKIRCGDLN